MKVHNRHIRALPLPSDIWIESMGARLVRDDLWTAMKGSEPVAGWLRGGYLVEEATKAQPEAEPGPIATAADRDADAAPMPEAPKKK